MSRQPKQPGMPLAPAPPRSIPSQILTDKDRAIIEQQARDHVLAAFTDFASAVQSHVNSIRAEETAKAEVASAILEIFFGFAAPIFSAKLLAAGGKTKALATKLANQLSTNKPQEQSARIKAAAEASEKSRQATLGARSLNEQAAKAEKAWKAAVKQAGDRNWANKSANDKLEQAKRAFATAQSEAAGAGQRSIEARQASELAGKARDAGDPIKLISEADILREGFVAAAKLGATAVKVNPDKLFGEKDVEPFARELQVQFRAGVQKITDDIAAHKLSDQALLAVWAAYDAEVANVNTYVEALKTVFAEFKKFIRPIGSSKVSYGTGSGRGERKTRGAWIRWAGRKRLAIIKDERPTGLGGKISGWERDMVAWVPEHLQAFVIRKTEREFGSVETIDHPEGEGSIHDLQAGIPEAVAEARRKGEREAAEKREREARARKTAEHFHKQNPNFGKGGNLRIKQPRTSTSGGNIDEEYEEFLRDTADW